MVDRLCIALLLLIAVCFLMPPISRAQRKQAAPPPTTDCGPVADHLVRTSPGDKPYVEAQGDVEGIRTHGCSRASNHGTWVG